MMNIKMIIAYDGTFYLGWQKTKMGPSIEQTLQSILEQVLQESISLQAASRTDAGVHARGQVVNFLTQKAQLDLKKLNISLNQLLPKDISVLSVEEERDSFHPTLDCSGKEYHYNLCVGSVQLPQDRFYSWHCFGSLNLEAMLSAIPYIIGERSFTSLTNVKKGKEKANKNSIRNVTSIEIKVHDGYQFHFIIKGNHFLYKMVRNIVGLLVSVGKKKILADSIPEILAKEDRTLAGVTAPAHGLTLYKVFY